jgi:hypothetical protein
MEKSYDQECSASVKSLSNQASDDNGSLWQKLSSFYYIRSMLNGRYLAESPLLFGIVVYIIFIAVGTSFFAAFFDWNFGTAFYVTMETGLNIGACEPAFGTGPPTEVKIFTVFYLVLGGYLICSILGFTLSALTYTKVDFFNVDHIDITIYHTDDNGSKQITIFSVFKYFWTKLKYYCGWYKYRTPTICTGIALIWLLFGVLYGMYGLGYDFITALYWALGTASTAGFYAPSCLHGTSGAGCDMGNFRGFMMGLYAAGACPLFAITTAQFALQSLSYATELQQAKLLRAPIKEAEFIFAANILSESSDTLQMGEFILLELMKLGCTDQEQITRLKQKFYLLDKDLKGVLNLEDLRLSGRIISSKNADLEVAKALRKDRARSASVSKILAAFSPASYIVSRESRAGSEVSTEDPAHNVTSMIPANVHARDDTRVRRASLGSSDGHESSEISAPSPDANVNNVKRRTSFYGYASFNHSYSSYIRRGSNPESVASSFSATSSLEVSTPLSGSPIHTNFITRDI